MRLEPMCCRVASSRVPNQQPEWKELFGMKNQCPVLSVRVNEANPNHHLFNNNGTWWLHATVHNPDFTKQRVRQSLKTHRLEVARLRRDVWLRQWRGTGIDSVDEPVAGQPCQVSESVTAAYALAA